MKFMSILFIIFLSFAYQVVLAADAQNTGMTPKSATQPQPVLQTDLQEKIGPTMGNDEALPLVDEGTINFIGGKVIEYHKHQVLHEKALDAYRQHEPIYYKENVVKIKNWKRIAVIKFMSFFEGSRSEIRIYDFNGTLINKETEFRGEVIIATPSDRILLGQRAKHYTLDKSILLDKNGRKVAELKHAPSAFKFGSSDDGKIFWVLSSLVRESQPRIQITVFDDAGLLLHTWETDKAQPVGFKFREKQYQFDVPAPAPIKQ